MSEKDDNSLQSGYVGNILEGPSGTAPKIPLRDLPIIPKWLWICAEGTDAEEEETQNGIPEENQGA